MRTSGPARSCADELGVDPGPGLAGCTRGCSAHDPTLELPVGEARIPAGAARAPACVERDEELQALRDAWQRRFAVPATVVVRGPEGAGGTGWLPPWRERWRVTSGAVATVPPTGRRQTGRGCGRRRARSVLLVADHADALPRARPCSTHLGGPRPVVELAPLPRTRCVRWSPATCRPTR